MSTDLQLALTRNLAWAAAHPEYTEGAFAVTVTEFDVQIQGEARDCIDVRKLMLSHEHERRNPVYSGRMHDRITATIDGVQVMHVVVLVDRNGAAS